MANEKPSGKLPQAKTLTPGKAGTGKGKTGIIMHTVGCGGNHLGSCNC